MHYAPLGSGECRGVQPHWQAVWRMCLHALRFFTFPLPESGECRGVQPHWQAEWRMCLHVLRFFIFPLRESGECRGVQPHWQAEWRMCLHRLIFFIFPLPDSGESRGAQPHWQAVWGVWQRKPPGMEDVRRFFTFPLRESGESRGEHYPSGRRYGGCASIDSSLFSPFLEGRGPGGWPHPRLPRRKLLAILAGGRRGGNVAVGARAGGQHPPALDPTNNSA